MNTSSIFYPPSSPLDLGNGAGVTLTDAEQAAANRGGRRAAARRAAEQAADDAAAQKEAVVASPAERAANDRFDLLSADAKASLARNGIKIVDTWTQTKATAPDGPQVRPIVETLLGEELTAKAYDAGFLFTKKGAGKLAGYAEMGAALVGAGSHLLSPSGRTYLMARLALGSVVDPESGVFNLGRLSDLTFGATRWTAPGHGVCARRHPHDHHRYNECVRALAAKSTWHAPTHGACGQAHPHDRAGYEACVRAQRAHQASYQDLPSDGMYSNAYQQDYPPGYAQDGSYPPGYAQDGSYPPGYVQDGGGYPPGYAQDGSYPPGYVQDGGGYPSGQIVSQDPAYADDGSDGGDDGAIVDGVVEQEQNIADLGKARWTAPTHGTCGKRHPHDPHAYNACVRAMRKKKQHAWTAPTRGECGQMYPHNQAGYNACVQAKQAQQQQPYQDGGGMMPQDGGGMMPQDGGGMMPQDGGGMVMPQDGGGMMTSPVPMAPAAVPVVDDGGGDGGDGSDDDSAIVDGVGSATFSDLGEAARELVRVAYRAAPRAWGEIGDAELEALDTYPAIEMGWVPGFGPSDPAQETFRKLVADWEAFDRLGVGDKVLPEVREDVVIWRTFRDGWKAGSLATSDFGGELNMRAQDARKIRQLLREKKITDPALTGPGPQGIDVVQASAPMKAADAVDAGARAAEAGARDLVAHLPSLPSAPRLPNASEIPWWAWLLGGAAAARLFGVV